MLSQIINNFYYRPSYKDPYYYINNVNIRNTYPTIDDQTPIIPSTYTITVGTTTTASQIIITTSDGSTITITAAAGTTADTLAGQIKTALPNIPGINSSVTTAGNTINVSNTAISDISTLGPGLSLVKTPPSANRVAEHRYGNQSKVRMEIRYGKDTSIFRLSSVLIDYLKVPQFIRLTQDQIDEVEDVSQVLEFPDYVCQEIVNQLIKLLLENSSDPRLQTNIPINQSIANPAQEQQQSTHKK
jgi:hypothetical protein